MKITIAGIGLLACSLVTGNCSDLKVGGGGASSNSQATSEETTTDQGSLEKADEKEAEENTTQTSPCLKEGCEPTQPQPQPEPTEAIPCSPPSGVDNGPTSIQGFLDFLNALPKPTTINCVLQSLKRPLAINATSNALSVQGATGPKSPRIFLRNGGLILTLLPEGSGSDAIELAEATLNGDTIKGELKFPISSTLTEDAPYRGLFSNGNAACAGPCHGVGYTEIKTYDATAVKYATEMVAPPANRTVTLLDLELIRDECGSTTSAICLFYQAIFDNGEVKAFDF